MPILYTKNNLNNDKYSLEHIYPISYLICNESKVDMHNLVKTTKYLNNARSNYKYTDFEEINFNINNKNWIELENFNYVNHKKKLFIPNNDSKGLISRAILYINDTYYHDINKVINLSALINWYINYPPDIYEKNHNNYVKKIQNTDNKFISNYKYYREKIYKNIKTNYNYYSNSS
jgi:endonuclease I